MMPLHRRAVKAWHVLWGTEQIGPSGFTSRQLARASRRADATPVHETAFVSGGGGGSSWSGAVTKMIDPYEALRRQH